jgi:tetratricopeptide (TPR) repeat protein
VNRGFAKQGKGDVDGAFADYNRAVELAAKLTIFCMDGTIADYNRAIELDPKQPRAYMNRGFAKQGKGDVDGAFADYNRALELAAKLAKH